MDHPTDSLFLDTAYIFALINTSDQWHEVAVCWQRKLAISKRRLVTTEFVLVEIADGLASIRFRDRAAQIIANLRVSPLVEIVPVSSHLFQVSFELYRNRKDKGWGLTDCTSFIIMKERGLLKALTSDDHFQQAGFRVLLLEDPAME